MTAANPRTVFRDKVVFALVALFLTLLAGVVWVTFGRERPAAGGKPVYTHMHCSACRSEVPYVAAGAGQDCTYCTKGKFVPTAGPAGTAGGRLLSGKTISFALVSLLLTEGLVYMFVLRSRAIRREQVDDAPRLVCRCPFCSRKIGYSLDKSGSGVICPQCKTAFLLAEPAADDAPV